MGMSQKLGTFSTKSKETVQKLQFLDSPLSSERPRMGVEADVRTYFPI